jgi:ankyrin repeat domain-containing protein 50
VLTFTSARVIEDLQAHCHGDEDVSLNYFYIDGSDQRSLDVECLYRSFIAQLVPRIKDLPSRLRYWRSPYDSEGNPLGGFVSIGKWEDILREVLRGFGHGYVVLDGLDECEGYMQASLDGITEFIRKIMEKIRNKVHLIAFSRDLERLRNIFKRLNATTIAIGGEALSLDLQTALRHQMSCQPKFAKWPPSLKVTIEASLLSQANGS